MINPVRCIALITLLLSLAACGGHEKADHAGHDHAAPPVDQTTPLSLTLDGENKWQMDDHTRSTFNIMTERFDGLSPTKADASYLSGIAAALESDIESLIAGCTMTGAAHDELHKYLAVYIPKVEQMKTTGELMDAMEVLNLLNEYRYFFE